MLEEKSESLSLSSVIVILNRNYGIFFFRDLRAYRSLRGDYAEWFLERTPKDLRVL